MFPLVFLTWDLSRFQACPWVTFTAEGGKLAVRKNRFLPASAAWEAACLQPHAAWIHRSLGVWSFPAHNERGACSAINLYGLPLKLHYPPSWERLFWLLDPRIHANFQILEIHLQAQKVFPKTPSHVRYFAKSYIYRRQEATLGQWCKGLNTNMAKCTESTEQPVTGGFRTGTGWLDVDGPRDHIHRPVSGENARPRPSHSKRH